MNKVRRPTVDALEIAALWLNCNEGDGGEAEKCHAVADWLWTCAENARAKKIAKATCLPKQDRK